VSLFRKTPQLTFEEASERAHHELDKWIRGESPHNDLLNPRLFYHPPSVINLGIRLSRAMIDAHNLRPTTSSRKPLDPVDEFYSLPPKHRTKARLRELIAESKK